MLNLHRTSEPKGGNADSRRAELKASECSGISEPRAGGPQKESGGQCHPRLTQPREAHPGPVQCPHSPCNSLSETSWLTSTCSLSRPCPGDPKSSSPRRSSSDFMVPRIVLESCSLCWFRTGYSMETAASKAGPCTGLATAPLSPGKQREKMPQPEGWGRLGAAQGPQDGPGAGVTDRQIDRG